MHGPRKLLAPLVCAAALVAGCPRDGAVKIGVVAPLTGRSALFGKPVVQGIELARDQLAGDAPLPRPIALDVRDSGSDPAKAAALLRDLYGDGALLALGGVTDAEAQAMVPVVDDEEEVLISPSATWSGLTGSSLLFFRVAPSAFREGAKMGNFVARELEIGTVASLAAGSPFAGDIRDVFQAEFERYGGEVVATADFPAGAADFGPFVARALAAHPQAVYVAGDPVEIGGVVSRLVASGFSGRILTTHEFGTPGAFVPVGKAALGVLLANPVFDPTSDDPAVRRFVDSFRAKFGTPPDFLAAQGYDAMMVAAEVVRGGRASTGRDVFKELRNLQGFVGVAGPVQFDEKGDVGKFPRIYAIQDGGLTDFQAVVEERRRIIQEQLEALKKKEREAAERARGGGP